MMADDNMLPMLDEDADFSTAMAARREVKRSQNAGLRVQIEASHPELAATYARARDAFAHLAGTVLEPTLSRIAYEGRDQGWHMRVVRDDETTEIFGAATPGIRLLISRDPLPSADIVALFGATTFVGFHGQCPKHAVKVTTELHLSDPPIEGERDEQVLDYEAVTAARTRDLVADVLRRLT